MSSLKSILVFAIIAFVPLRAGAQRAPTAPGQPADALDQIVNKIVIQEQEEMKALSPYNPLVETYVQNMKGDKDTSAPAGDNYFIGRAVLSKGVDLEPLSTEGVKKKISSFFSLAVDFDPRGFLQMIYIDTNGFDQSHYKFDFVRREFLGEVRTLVFDVSPLPKSGKGRFMGRIWVEDQGFHIIRFNGDFGGSSNTNYYFHFDSWRVNAGPNLWLPAYIYSEETSLKYSLGKTVAFKAQTRLWGYNLGRPAQEEELSKVLIESQTPVKDESASANDLSPVMEQRSWDRQAEDNILDRLQRFGLLGPTGDVDKVLDTVANNIEVTNNLDIEPEIRCRVLLTSTLESFAVGHTVVLSRGLIDVIPDEATLALMVAREMAHIVLNHRTNDEQFAFFDRVMFDEKDTFHHFGFAHSPEEEAAANAKASQLLANSPYKDQLATAQLFLNALDTRQTEIPSLISPHLGDRVQMNLGLASSVPVPSQPTAPLNAPAGATNGKVQVVALPLGGRIKMDPWNDRLEMLKSKPVEAMSARETMPFEVTPFMLYVTRENSTGDAAVPGAVSADSKPTNDDKPPQH